MNPFNTKLIPSHRDEFLSIRTKLKLTNKLCQRTETEKIRTKTILEANKNKQIKGIVKLNDDDDDDLSGEVRTY